MQSTPITEIVQPVVSPWPMRWMTASLVLMVLFTLGHFAGFLQARHAARNDPALADLTRAMRSHTSTLMGFSPSILDFREYFSVNFSILMALASALTLAGVLAASPGPARTQAIHTIAMVDLLAMALLLVTSAIYHIPQGLISCGAIALTLAAAWWTSR